MKKIRVLQIGKYYYPYVGGFESSLHTLVNELAAELDISVLVSHTAHKTVIEKDKNSLIVRLANFGRIFSQPITPTHPFWLKRLECDIVHLHLPNPLAMISYLMVSPPGKLIVSYHNDIIRPKFGMAVLAPLLTEALQRAAAIIVTSENLIESSPVLKRFRKKCFIIPHGIDIDRFKITPAVREEAGRIKSGVRGAIILFVGRLVYYKGLEYLIDAMKNIDATLVIIGDGQERDKLESLSRRKGVENKILWRGSVPDELLPAYYHACDLFVLPSCVKSESFGLVILEAHACGKPVVSTNLPTGVTFTNLHQKTGLVVPPGNSFALAQAVNRLLGSQDLREAYGANGRQRAEKEFSKEIMAQKFLTLYNTINNN